MVKDPLPCGDGTVDNIYCSHVIEHLPNEVVSRFLGEAHRVIRDGGTLRIACPMLSSFGKFRLFPMTSGDGVTSGFLIKLSTLTPHPNLDEAISSYARSLPQLRSLPISPQRVAYDDSIFDGDFDTAIKTVSQDLEFIENFPGDHINAWTFAKFDSFARSVASQESCEVSEGDVSPR